MNITFGGHAALLVPAGAIWFPELKLLAAADLHFGKGSFFTRHATMLPPYDSVETLQRLSELVQRFQPEIFVAVGDSFHDHRAVERLSDEDIQGLNILVASVPQWYWLSGNHDPSIGDNVKGRRQGEFKHDDLLFRHQAEPGSRHEISGHYHPKHRVKLAGHRISGRCFVHYNDSLILPAFGEYTGGLSIDHAALREIAPLDQRKIYFIHQDDIYAL